MAQLAGSVCRDVHDLQDALRDPLERGRRDRSAFEHGPIFRACGSSTITSATKRGCLAGAKPTNDVWYSHLPRLGLQYVPSLASNLGVVPVLPATL